MKKLILLLVVAVIFAGCEPILADNVLQPKKTEIVKCKDNDSTKVVALKVPFDTLKSDVEIALKDSLVQAELLALAKDSIANHPAKDAGFWKWFIFISIILLTAIGFIISQIKLRKAYWWLMPVQTVCKALIWFLKNLLTPKNKNEDGGNHSV